MIPVEIVLDYLHGLELFETRLFGDFILSVVGVMLQMAYIGDIAHIAYLVAEMLEVTVYNVKGYGGTGVSEMAVAIDRWSAYIHTHPLRVDRSELLLGAGE